MKPIFKLLILSALCMFIWLGEVLVRGWAGLQWLNYFHYEWLIILLFIFLLVIRADRKIIAWKHLIAYPILILVYLIPLLMICSAIIQRHHDSIIPARQNLQFFIATTAFGIFTYLINIIVARMEKVKLSLKHKLLLFFSAYFIPFICLLVTVLLFSQQYIFSKYSIEPFKQGFQLIHWIKSGSYLFAFILYEGYYYLWLKGRFNYPSQPISPK